MYISHTPIFLCSLLVLVQLAPSIHIVAVNPFLDLVESAIV